jgi:hypothetical protein
MRNNSPIAKPTEPDEVIPDSPYKLSLQGDLFRLQVILPKMDHYSGGKKSMVFHFSRQSRLNLLKIIAAVDWPKMDVPLFITLTYRDDCFPVDARQMGIERWRFQRYAEQYLKKTVPTLWRIEWKPRQSGSKKGYLCPHYHLLMFTPAFLPAELVKEWWQKALCTDMYVRTDVQRASSGQNGGYYVAKYASKDSSSLVHAAYLNTAHAGRTWGIMRKELMAYHSRVVVRKRADDFGPEQLGRALNALGIPRPYWSSAFTLFGTQARSAAIYLMHDALESIHKMT